MGNPEKYYVAKLKLNLPNRSDEQLKPSTFQTFEDFCKTGYIRLEDSTLTKVSDIVQQNQDKFEKDR